MRVNMSEYRKYLFYAAITLFTGLNHAAEPSKNNGKVMLEIVCDKDSRAWIKELRFHNGIDTIQTAFFDQYPVMCRNGELLANNKVLSRELLLDKYRVLLSEKYDRYGQPSRDPQAVLSACNNAESVQEYKGDSDKKRYNELQRLCDIYKKRL